MKPSITLKSIIIVFSITFIFPLTAQTDTIFKNQASGGFCDLFAGASYFKSQTMNDYLKKTDVLGSSYSPSEFGNTMGIEGNAVVKRVTVGMGGFGVMMPTTSTDVGRAKIKLAGLYGKVGYKFLEKPHHFMSIYLGLGGLGYDIMISNLSDSLPLNFNRKVPIQPNRKRAYSLGGFLIDVGLSLKTIAFCEDQEIMRTKMGLILGVNLGVLIGLPTSEWMNKNTVVAGPPDIKSLSSPYIRLTLGHAHFRYK